MAIDTIRVDIRGGGACGQGPDCLEFVASWERWMAKNARRPLAMLDCSPGYRQRLGRNGRQMLNKADRLYSYRPIVRNEHLAAMHVVNTSAEVRQGRVMSAAYREPLEPGAAARLCSYHRDEWHGGFEDGRLVVYARAEMFGDLALLNTILSDKAAGGAMVDALGIDEQRRAPRRAARRAVAELPSHRVCLRDALGLQAPVRLPARAGGIVVRGAGTPDCLGKASRRKEHRR